MRTQFVDLTEIDEAMAHRLSFVLWPRKWKKYVRSHGWRLERLEVSKRAMVPDAPGIYTLILQPGIAGHCSCSYLMYVGQAMSLRTRFGDYLGRERRESGRPKLFHFLNKYDGYVWFCYTKVAAKALNNIENGLLRAYIPPLNDQLPSEVSRVVSAF